MLDFSLKKEDQNKRKKKKKKTKKVLYLVFSSYFWSLYFLEISMLFMLSCFLKSWVRQCHSVNCMYRQGTLHFFACHNKRYWNKILNIYLNQSSIGNHSSISHIFSTMDDNGQPCSGPCWTMVNYSSRNTFFFSTMDNHGRPCSGPYWTMVNHGSKNDILFYHGRPWSTMFRTIDFHGNWWLTMKKHGWPSKTLVTMADHGHHFAWAVTHHYGWTFK